MTKQKRLKYMAIILILAMAVQVILVFRRLFDWMPETLSMIAALVLLVIQAILCYKIVKEIHSEIHQ